MPPAFIRLSCVLAAAFAFAGVLPAQTITNISPQGRVAGDPQFTLFVNGSGFNTCTRARWNGQDLSTNVSSATLLSAQVPAALLANPGNASITVFRYNFAVGSVTTSCAPTGGTASNPITFNVHPPVTITNPTPLPNGRVNQTYTQVEFQTSGGMPQANYTWGVVQGSLPPGLNLSSSGLLTGVSTQAGTFSFAIRAADCVIDCSLVHSATKTFTITIQAGITIAPTAISSGAVCASYNQQFTATGGIAPYTFSAMGLPPGLTLNNNTITGRPTQNGTFPIAIRAVDSSNQSATQNYNLVVGPAAFTIATSSLPSGRAGTAYDQTITATGGEQPYTWSAVSGLPGGLAVSTVTNNGRIAGTPTQSGAFQTVIRVTDAVACVATRTFPLNIAPGDLQIVTTSLNSGFVGTPYSQTLQATGGASPYNWSITSAQIPGLVLSPGGVLSGTPTSAGSFTVTVQVIDSTQQRATRNFTVVVTAPLTIVTPSLNSGSVGASYTQTLQATGGSGGYSWSIASGQAPGLTLNSNGVLSGIPLTAGAFPLSIQVMDSSERTATRSYTLQIGSSVTIVTTSLPNGAVGVPYSQVLQAAGGATPYTWTVSGGQLPPGLSLNTAGTLTGTPQVAGPFSFNVQVTDSAQAQASRAFSLQISSGLTITTSALSPARVGQPYELQLQASGGFGALQWSSLTGLPPGFTINATTGVLSGTATATGDFPITFQVMDASGAIGTRTLVLNVLSTFSITTESLPNAQTGVPYTASLSASGGVVPFRWQALNELPPGLTLDPFGVLSGTLQQTGSFPVHVQVADSAGGTAARQFTLVVTSQFRITTEGLPNGSVGVFYNTLLQSTGGRAPIRWGLDSGQLPLGLILNSNTGAIAGTPQQSGDFRFTIFANDADQLRATQTFTVTIRGQFTITTQSLPGGTVGTAYTQTIATTGGSAPFRWSVSSGSLPAGLQLGVETGVIAGTPTNAGTFDFTIQATENNGLQAQQQYSLVINSRAQFTITTQTLPNGVTGTAYSQTLATTGGTAPFRWSVQAGALPTGLQLGTANGVISGTPSAAGTFDFTVQALDNSNAQARQQYSVTIIGPPSITNTSLPSAGLNQEYTAVVEATGGQPPYTWSQTGLPEGLTLEAASGLISGIPARAGSFPVNITVRDSAALTASRQFTIVVASGLSITITSLPSGTAGAPYAQTLQAAGGSGGFSWSVASGALPAGLTLSAAGALQGTPSRPGDFAFTVQVSDSQGNTASQALTVRIAELVLSRVTIRTATLQAGAGDQPSILLELTDPAPAPLAGTLSLTFVSDAGATDPALQFSQGATPRFTIAEGSRTAVFTGGALNLQLGTIAGTATVTAAITAGGVNVTPSPAPSLAIRIERAAPVISTMTLARTATTLTVELTGFATSREVTSAEFQFNVRQGANVQASSFTVPLTTPFTEWYRGATSVTFGSAFRLTMPFNVTGSTADLTGVTVTLVNAVGRSQPRTGTF